MSLRRGDIVFVAVKGPYTTKPRPVVVVQATQTLGLMESVTVMPASQRRFGCALCTGVSSNRASKRTGS
ncbi:MAG: hypothetical protein EXR28_04990 [Betaproteobacteria bacterium]|nr:hypothetical protein [Betaproteobacteria bacterium]